VSWDGLKLSVTLLTVVPVGRSPGPGRREAGAAIMWAPVVGLGLGVVAALVFLASRHPAGELTAAALTVSALALLTRGLHLDGLADLADGLGSGRPADEALAIMRKSDIGPFGVVTLVLTLLIQVSALAHGAGPYGLAAAVVTGRLAIVWACREGVPAARGGGLGAMVAGTVRPAVACAMTATVIGACAGLAAGGIVAWTLPAGVAAGCAVAFVVARHAVRRLGGITGDLLGALTEIATTVCLVVAALTG
jgi:adenosylcobinamide-GDP ribazoletransferase